jgi:uncharacterized membrane protein YozB (DUF420 family)
LHWLSRYHDAIEAVAAVGALVASLLLVIATVALWRATRRLHMRAIWAVALYTQGS